MYLKPWHLLRLSRRETVYKHTEKISILTSSKEITFSSTLNHVEILLPTVCGFSRETQITAHLYNKKGLLYRREYCSCENLWVTRFAGWVGGGSLWWGYMGFTEEGYRPKTQETLRLQFEPTDRDKAGLLHGKPSGKQFPRLRTSLLIPCRPSID